MKRKNKNFTKPLIMFLITGFVTTLAASCAPKKSNSIDISDLISGDGNSSNNGSNDSTTTPPSSEDIPPIEEEGELKYTIVNNNGNKYVEVSEGTNVQSITEIEVPSRIEIKGAMYEVKSIKAGTFANYTSLRKITLPFLGTTNTTSGTLYSLFGTSVNNIPVTLKEVVIKGGTTLGSSAFKDCANLTSITIANTFEEIKKGAFKGCSSLESIELPFVGARKDGTKPSDDGSYGMGTTYDKFGWIFGFGSVAEQNNISNQRQYIPANLEKVTINGGTKIVNNAFAYSDIFAITIKASVGSIEWNAFDSTTSIIYFENSNSSLFSGTYNSATAVYFGVNENTSKEIDNMRFVIRNGKAILAENLKDERTKFIPDTIDISNTNYEVEEIGKYAFKNHTNLQTIELPNHLRIINHSAFYGCTSLENVTLLDNVIEIGEKAFYNCTSLTSIRIPDSVSTIGSSAFENCRKLSSVSIPSKLTVISERLFSNCEKIEKIEIPYGVQTIGDYAFENCRSLKTILIPNTVTSIGRSAFYGCSSLASVSIPSSVTTIGTRAFEACGVLTIYAEVTSKPAGWFYDYGGSWNQDNRPVVWGIKEIDGILYRLSGSTATIIGMLDTSEQIIIPSIVYSEGKSYSVTSIDKGALSEAKDVTSLTLPFAPTYLGLLFGASSASQNSTYVPNSLKEVTISGGSEIRSEAFINCTSIEKITLSSTITSIGAQAFYNCKSLESFIVPQNVTSIGNGAFQNCSKLKEITLPFVGGSSSSTTNSFFSYIFGAYSSAQSNNYLPIALKKVTITKQTVIPDGAFESCSNIEEIILPYSTTKIGNRAFKNCTSLTNFVIPSSVTSIGQEAFVGCVALSDINVSNKTEEVGKDAFDENMDFAEYGNSLYIGTSTNPYYVLVKAKNTDVEEITIHQNTKVIADEAFVNCMNLTSITIPSSVTNIGKNVFKGCNSLSSLTLSNMNNPLNYYFGSKEFIPSSLKQVTINGGTAIVERAFEGCSDIVTINLPSTLKTIGASAFSGCSSLNTITIPSTVTTIGSNAFKDCVALEEVVLPNSLTTIENGILSGCTALRKLTLPNSFEYLGKVFGATSYTQNSSYVPSSLKEVIVTGGTSIENYAFYGCGSLTSIILSNGIKTIGASAFNGCNSLASLTIPGTVTSIGSNAFKNCSSLKLITIPSDVKTMGSSVFKGCTQLFIYCEAESKPSRWDETWNPDNRPAFWGQSEKDVIVIDNIRYTIIDGKAIVTGYVGEIVNLTIPQFITDSNGTNYEVVSIGSRAFQGCNSLKSVTITASIYEIGDGAFYNCNQIEEMTLPIIPEYLGKLFGADSYAQNSIFVPSSLKNLNFIGGDNIAAHAFEGCSSLETIILPYSLSSIGESAFASCESLRTLNIPTYVMSIGNGAFKDCKSLEKVVIPDSVMVIGEELFYGCSALTLVIVPNSVMSIEARAFEGCESLSNIRIPSSVMTIGESAFKWCTSLEAITLSSNVLNVGENAFATCRALIIFCDMDALPGGWSRNWNPDNRPVYLNSSEEDVVIIEGIKYLVINDNVIVIGCTNDVVDLVIPNQISINGTTYDVKQIVSGAFANRQIVSAVIGNKITNIGDGIFYNCNELQTITLPYMPEYLGYLFGASSYLENEDYVVSSLKYVAIISGTEIYENAFYNCSSLTSITLPNTLEYIRNGAFEGCSSLGEITIPSSVKTIGNEAFKGCESLQTIIIPSLVTSLGDRAFENCINLQSILFENNSKLESIGQLAFNGCSSLKAIVIPNSVTSMGQNMLSGCESLQSLTLPYIDTYLGYYFGASSYSKNATFVPSSLKTIVITGGNEIASHAFYDCSEITSITLPNTIESIRGGAFQNCTSLIGIVIPSSVMTIESFVFSNCSSLKTVTFNKGSNLKTIKESAFASCTSLTSITLPSSLKTIGANAFTSCDKLSTLNFEENSKCQTIGNGAFQGCISLTTIYIPRSVESIDNNAFKGCINITSFVIEDGSVLSSIGAYAFDGLEKLSYIIFPSTTINVGYGAFDNCSIISIYSKASNRPSGWSNGFNPDNRPVFFAVSNIYELDGIQYAIINGKAIVSGYIPGVSEVNIPTFIEVDGQTYDVIAIGESAFRGCETLTSIYIANSITSIGAYAFEGCTLLTTISIPSTIEEIGTGAFNNCNSLNYYVLNNCNYLGNETNRYLVLVNVIQTNATTVSIQNTTKVIMDHAFKDCNALTSIIVPDSVLSLGFAAFENCSSLQSITISYAPDYFGYLFGASTYEQNANYVPSSLKTIIIRGGNEIKDHCFEGCTYITSVTLRNTITSIGERAFSECTSLSSIVIPASVENIGAYAFYNCKQLNSVVIPASVEVLGKYAFYGCSALTSIVIPNLVTEIKEYTFYGCSSLSSITLSNNITSIGEYAFYGCSVETLTLPSSLETLGNSAFENCKSLKSIVIPTTLKEIGNDCFKGCTLLKEVHISNISKWAGIDFKNEYSNPLYLGAKLYKDGKLYQESNIVLEGIDYIGNYAFYNCDFIKSIVIPSSITSIEKSAFCECTSLESLTLPYIDTYLGYYFGASSYSNNSSYVPSSLKEVIILGGSSVPNYAFYGCKYIISIAIPSSVTSIEDYAFSGCSSLTSIKIPSSVTSIGSYAFSGCSSLTSTVISSSITSIGQNAFQGCTSLKSLTLPYIDTYLGYYFGASSYGYNSIYVPSSLKEVIILGGSSIPYEAFSGCSSLTTITIPSSVTSIGVYTFRNCSSLVIYCESESKPSGWAYNWNSDRPVYWGVTASDIYTQDGIQYIIQNGEAIITGHTSDLPNNVVIPNAITINEKVYSVTRIGEKAFQGCTSLKSLTLPYINTYLGYYFGASSYNDNSKYVPSSLKEVMITGGSSISGYAFYGCSSLTSITISNSVTSIGDYAFYGCSSLTSIVIPSSVTSIGKNALQGCTSLKSLTLPYINTYLGYYFGASSYSDNSKYVPSSLKKVIILGGSSIATNAFYGCSSLTSIEIPNSVTSIGQNAFYGCGSLQYNEYGNCYYLGNEENPYLVLIKVKDTSITSATIIENTKVIYYDAFYNCSSLTSITISNSVTSIGDYAFYGCSSLTSIVIPSSVTSIGKNALQGCTSLKSLTLPYINTYLGYYFGASSYNDNSKYVPSSLKKVIILGGSSIATNAFYGCSSLTSIEITSSVTSIGKSAFQECTSLESLTLPYINTYLGYYFGASLSNENSRYIPSSLKEVIILGGNSIHDDAFNGCSSLTSITIPSSVTSIGEYAFNGCSSLTSIVIPSSVTSIGGHAFRNCTKLQTVTFEDGSKLESIGYSAFYDCSSLTSIVIPSSVTSIGNYAFYGCSSLVIYCEAKSKPSGWLSSWNYSNRPVYWSVTDSCIYIQDGIQYLIQNGEAITTGYTSYLPNKIVIPNTIAINGKVYNVTSIGKYAFYDCSSLTSIVIPISVTSIEKSAFYGCTSLESLTLPYIDTYLGYYFGASTYSENLSYVPSSLKKVIILGGNSIPNSAFYGCGSLTSIIIPSSITSIEYGAFKLCGSLTSLTIPSSVTSIGEDAFWGCISLESLTLPYINTYLGYYFGANSYSNNSSYIPSSLKEVIILDRSIASYAFYNCKSLTSIVIPSSATSIGTWAFMGCSSLTSIVIPSSVQFMGINTFYGCSSLTIYCEAESQPYGWQQNWWGENSQIYWAGEWSYVNGVPKPNK